MDRVAAKLSGKIRRLWGGEGTGRVPKTSLCEAAKVGQTPVCTMPQQICADHALLTFVLGEMIGEMALGEGS